MTTLNANLAFAPAALNFAQGLNGASLTLAAGILGRYFNPLGAGPYAFPKLPNQWNVGVGTPSQPPVATWSATTGADGRGSIDLGDGYKLELNEHNSEITVINANTGERTRIWGDPHVDVDGKHVFDFWGTTTFKLENGTKITINTEQFGRNPNAYVASQVVITKGDQAIVVDGISENQKGDLAITMSNDGRYVDSQHRDGFVLNENASGAGWRSSATGQIATQADLNVTRVGQEYGPGSRAASFAEFAELLSTYLHYGVFADLSDWAEGRA